MKHKKSLSSKKPKNGSSILDSTTGIGNYRPTYKGPYGGFKVVSWEEISKKK